MIGNIISGVLGAGTLIAGIVVATRKDPDGRQNMPATLRERIVKMASYKPSVKWRNLALRPEGTRGLRKIPIVQQQHTYLVPEYAGQRTGAALEASVRALQGYLRDAGHGDLDARVLWMLFAQETGYGRYGWNYNVGNVKANWTVFATRESILEGYVYTPVSSMVNVYCLTDLVKSFDCYGGYDGWPGYLRYFVALLESGSGADVGAAGNYKGAVPALREGGLDGALKFAYHLSKGCYSNSRLIWRASAAARQRQYRGRWAEHRAKVGSRWDTRF